MTTQAERTLQAEVMLRLRAGAWPVIAIPVPNGVWIPAQDDAEKRIVARIVARMKADGLLLPGAFDLSLHWRGGGGIIDLKRPASRDLLGRRSPAGKPTPEQLDLAERAERCGINYAFCTSWDEVRGRLQEWAGDLLAGAPA